MKKKILWIVLAVVLVAVLAVAGVLYNRLTNRVEPETPSVTQQTQTAQTDTSGTQATEAAAELAADFTVLDANGEDDSLSAHIGKPVIVNFWATWCGYCIQELPAFDAAAEQYADEIDFMMVDLTDGRSETVEGARAFIEQNGFTFPVYFDTYESAASAYGIYSIPVTLFIAADGTLADSFVGAMSEDMLKRNIESLLTP